MTSDPDEMLEDLMRDGEVMIVSISPSPTNAGLVEVQLAVICSDVFAWGSSDCEPVSFSELPEVYLAWRKDRNYGTMLWACRKRNRRPQQAWERKLKDSGHWSNEFESLPKEG